MHSEGHWYAEKQTRSHKSYLPCIVRQEIYQVYRVTLSNILLNSFTFIDRMAKKRGRKAKEGKDETGKDGKKSQAAGKGTSTSQEKMKIPGKHDVDHAVSKTGSNTERPESHQTEKSDSQTAVDVDK